MKESNKKNLIETCNNDLKNNDYLNIQNNIILIKTIKDLYKTPTLINEAKDIICEQFEKANRKEEAIIIGKQFHKELGTPEKYSETIKDLICLKAEDKNIPLPKNESQWSFVQDPKIAQLVQISKDLAKPKIVDITFDSNANTIQKGY